MLRRRAVLVAGLVALVSAASLAYMLLHPLLYHGLGAGGAAGNGAVCWSVSRSAGVLVVRGYPGEGCVHTRLLERVLGLGGRVVLTGVFYIDGFIALTVSGLEVYGEDAVLVYLNGNATLGFVSSRNVSVEGLVVYGHLGPYGYTQPGLWARNSSGVVFRGNTVRYGSYGIAVLYGSRNVVVEDNVLAGFVDDAVTVTNSSYTWVRGNVVYGLGVRPKTACSSGIEVDDGSHHVYIYNNSVWMYNNTGIHVHYHKRSPAPHDIVIAYNSIYIDTPGSHGIGVQALYLSRPIRNIVVANNTVRVRGGYGIVLTGVVNGSVVGNTVAWNTAYIVRSRGIVVEHNCFRDYYVIESWGIDSVDNIVLKNNTSI